jgi:FkbM family methyltransferase
MIASWRLPVGGIGNVGRWWGMISDLAFRSIAYVLRLPSSRKLAVFDQLAKTVELLARLKINVILDVGANRGFYAKHLRDAGYDGHLFSFEPISSDCEKIKLLSDGDEKWLALNYALGAENGTKQFNIIETKDGQTVLSSFLATKDLAATTTNVEISSFLATQDLTATTTNVEIRRLDEVLPGLISNISDPRIFMKMDTQGFDGEVISGAGDYLHQTLAIQSEISVVPIYDGMLSYTESLARYHNLGFKLVDLFVVGRTEDGLVVEYDCLMRR